MSRPGLVLTLAIGFLACAAAPAFAAPVELALPGPGPFAGRLPLRATLTPGNEVVQVEFRVRDQLVAVDDSAPFTADFETADVADGPASVTATAVDADGRVRTSDPVATVLDNTVPSVSVTGPDKQTFAPGTVQSWTVGATDATAGVRGVRCALVVAGGVPTYAPCPSGEAFTARDLESGSYAFIVHAFDTAGNMAETIRRFAIDGVAPLTRFLSGMRDGAATTENAFSWTFESNEPRARFECRLVPAAFAPCTSGFAVRGLTPGDYTVEVRSIDAVGNIDATPARRTFTVLAALTDLLSASGLPGAADPATPTATATSEPEQLTFTLVYKFTPPTAHRTRLVSVVARDIPTGATVTGRRGKHKLVRPAAAHVSLSTLVRKPMRAGTRITISVSRPGALTATKVLRIRASKAPLVTSRP